MPKRWVRAEPGDVLDTSAGRAKFLDGWASGQAWYSVQFQDGELAGHTVWLQEGPDAASATYRADHVEDGDLFNPADASDAAGLGGEYLPAHDGLVVRIV